MFVCAVTGKVSKPGEPMVKVVVETRPKQYVNLVTRIDENGREFQETVTSTGWEIVREIQVTPEGYEQLLKAQEGFKDAIRAHLV